ncbi:MAG: glycosyltransferase family 4 protein [Actinomycetes bacterium]
MDIVMLNRRDTANPEGGGSEVYLESIAIGLVAKAHKVTIFCGAHDRAPDHETIQGVRFVRAGSKLGVHGKAWQMLRNGSLGRPDVIVDVQNGIPFFSNLAIPGVPTVVLVHHLHKEQWPVVYGPVRSRIGWFLESRIAPRVYRRSSYVAVSQGTKSELVKLGIDPQRISIIYNGTENLPEVHQDSSATTERDPSPRILVLGRLVPHKQIEHVLWAASVLRSELPDLRVSVVGDGWWAEELRDAAVEFGVSDIVDFTGFCTEDQKHRELARAWLLALPSLKEGWGIVVMEAARHGVPAVGYRSASGVAESIVDRHTGLLVDGGRSEFLEGLRMLLHESELRRQMGEAARSHSLSFSWERSIDDFESLLRNQVADPAAHVPQPRDESVVAEEQAKAAHVRHQ